MNIMVLTPWISVIIIISIIIFTSARSHKQTLTNSQQISFIFFAGSKKKKWISVE
jgi:hypothetical protein